MATRDAQLPSCCPIRCQSICADAFWTDTGVLEKLPEQTHRSLGIAAFLNEDVEDFAFVVDRSVLAGDVVKAALSGDRTVLTDAEVFDVYEGVGIAEGKKSVASSVTLQPRDRTLTDAEIDGVATRIVAAVMQKTGATLRG